MKDSLKRALALILALMLVFSLSACGKDNGDEEDDDVNPGSVDGASPKDDPAGYLSAAMQATAGELSERYSGSPIKALSNVRYGSGSTEFAMDLSQDGQSAQVGGTLAFDTEADKLKLDAYIGFEGQQVDASLYADKDFLGVSVPALLGNDEYYGFVPHDLYDQVSGSAFASLMEEEDLEVLHELDSALESMSNIDFSGMDDYRESVERIANEFTSSMKFTAEEAQVTVNGKNTDGWMISTAIESGEIADLLQKLTDAMYSGPIWEQLGGLGSSFGVDTDELTQSRAEPDEMITEIRESGIVYNCDCSVADGKVVSVHVVPTGDNLENNIDISVDFYTDDMTTLTMSVDGQIVTVTSAVTSSRGKYNHTVTMSSGDDRIVLSADWSDNRLEVSLDTGDGTARLTGDFGVSDDGFYLNDANITIPDGADSTSVDFFLKYTAGGQVTTPSILNNIFEMDNQELINLIYAMSSAFGSM